MEILALLFIGLIAVLAIVPPLVKGKIDASPLCTTEEFQRSMWLIGSSLELGEEEHACQTERMPRLSSWPQERTQLPPIEHVHPPVAVTTVSKSTVKRNRIIASFALAATGFALGSLASESLLVFGFFIASTVLLVIYCLLAVAMPYLLGSRREPLAARLLSFRRS
jgi:hypothetical protein